MSELACPTFEESRMILDGPRDMDLLVVATIGEKLGSGVPLYDVDAYGAFVAGLLDTDWQAVCVLPNGERAKWTFTMIGALGACSIESAALQAGHLALPQPRKTVLHEHNQDVANTRLEFGAIFMSDPRDAILPFVDTQQDGGKSYGVALDGNNRRQGVYNLAIFDNVTAQLPGDVLSSDARAVARLLIQEHFIGRAVREHHVKRVALEDAVGKAEVGLNTLREQCPDDYRDRFNVLLLAGWMNDSAAHRQKAHHISAQTGQEMPAIRDIERYNPDGSETGLTLDYLYDGSLDNRLQLIQPAHLRVMRRLFPELEEFYA